MVPKQSLMEEAPVEVVLWYLGHRMQSLLPNLSAYAPSGHGSHTGTFSVKPTPFTIRDCSISAETCPRSQLTTKTNAVIVFMCYNLAYSIVDSQN